MLLLSLWTFKDCCRSKVTFTLTGVYFQDLTFHPVEEAHSVDKQHSNEEGTIFSRNGSRALFRRTAEMNVLLHNVGSHNYSKTTSLI